MGGAASLHVAETSVGAWLEFTAHELALGSSDSSGNRLEWQLSAIFDRTIAQ